MPVMSRFRHARRNRRHPFQGGHFRSGKESFYQARGNRGEIWRAYAGCRHMDTYDARYEADGKGGSYRTRKISAAVGTFRKEAVLETSAVPEKTVAVEKTETTEAQPSSGEMRFKGGRRELTIRNGSAVLRTNGESFDATDILKDMSAHGVDIDRVSGKAMSEMLKGNKTALPGASGNSVFAIVKGPAGYGLKAFQIAKQVHSAAAQEI